MPLRCYRRPLNITYNDPVANKEVRCNLEASRSSNRSKRKLRWHSHITIASGMAKTILKGAVKAKGEEEDSERGWKAKLRTGQDSSMAKLPEQLKVE